MPSFLGYIEKEGKLPEHLTFSLAALMAFYTGTEIRDKALIGHRGEQEYNILDDAAVLEFLRQTAAKSQENSHMQSFRMKTSGRGFKQSCRRGRCSCFLSYRDPCIWYEKGNGENFCIINKESNRNERLYENQRK